MNGRRCNTGRTAKLLSLTVAAAGVLGGLAQLTSNPDGCVTDYDASAGVDYFPDKAVIDYAETFSVEYFSTYKVLTIMDAFSSTSYVLYQCGTPEPTLDMTVQQYISVPVTNVSTGTTDHIPRIELLGKRDSIVAYTGDTSRIGSPCVDSLVDNGTVVEALVFDTECQLDTIDNAALANASVEVNFGDSLTVSYCEGADPILNGVQVLSYAEAGDNIGLAHGEAIKLFSLFYNLEALGNTLFEEIEALWLCTENNAQGCSVLLDDSPTVAWFPFLPTDPNSNYYGAGSGYGAPNNDSYYSQAVESTGGTLLYCGDFGFALMTDDEMLACFQDADVCVIGADYSEVLRYFDNDVLDQLACVQNERVYDITLSGQNAWFEARQVEPHVLMGDMVVVLHGDDFDFGIGSYERLLLRNVFTEDSDSGTYYPDVGTCTDPDAVVELQGECETIIDFDTVCDGSLTADGTADDDSPASSVVPTLSVLGLAFLAAAATLW
eukprot:g8357.t1